MCVVRACVQHSHKPSQTDPGQIPGQKSNRMFCTIYILTTLCPAFSPSQFPLNLQFFLSTISTPSPFATHPLSYSFCLTTNLTFLLLSSPPFSLHPVCLFASLSPPTFLFALSSPLLSLVQFSSSRYGEEYKGRCENRRKWWKE